MFEKTQALFMYCTSPLHVGAGTSLGAVDNPIQREVHTGYPMVPGSGIKGALRHLAAARGLDEVADVFGPSTEEANSDGHRAGALAVSDARLVLFPVRCARAGYVYATCPNLLGGLARVLEQAGIGAEWYAPKPGELQGMNCAVSNDEIIAVEGKVLLELYEFEVRKKDGGASDNAAHIATWLAKNAIPNMGTEYFRDKVKDTLVILPNDKFDFFVRNSTVVEPHVRISDDTGAADDGGLFYSESLPPESLLVSLVAASKVRRPKGEGEGMDASGVLEWLGKDLLEGEQPHVQIGGDATTGRGQVALKILAPGEEESA